MVDLRRKREILKEQLLRPKEIVTRMVLDLTGTRHDYMLECLPTVQADG